MLLYNQNLLIDKSGKIQNTATVIPSAKFENLSMEIFFGGINNIIL